MNTQAPLEGMPPPKKYSPGPKVWEQRSLVWERATRKCKESQSGFDFHQGPHGNFSLISQRNGLGNPWKAVPRNKARERSPIKQKRLWKWGLELGKTIWQLEINKMFRVGLWWRTSQDNTWDPERQRTRSPYESPKELCACFKRPW